LSHVLLFLIFTTKLYPVLKLCLLIQTMIIDRSFATNKMCLDVHR